MMISFPRGRLFAAACAGMAEFGFSLTLLGTLFGFLEFRNRLHVDVMKQGEMSSLLFLGIWASTVIVGPLIDRFGNRVALSASSFLVSAAFWSFAFSNSFALACTSALLLGLGGGGLNTATNATVSELYDDKRGGMLNILGIFFGLGGVLVPLLAVRISPDSAILFAAVFSASCGVMYLFLQFPPAKEARSFSLREAARVLAYPGVLLFAILLFFESANEQVLSTFTSTWLGEAGATARLATLVLAGYQLSMAVGRIIAAPLLKLISKQQMVIASAIGSLAGTTIMFTCSGSIVGMAVGVVVSGLSFAAIYPTVLALAGDRYQRFAGTVFGAIFAIALVGGICAPSAVGVVGRSMGSRFGILVPVLGTFMVAVMASIVIMSRTLRRPMELPRPSPFGEFSQQDSRRE